MSEPGQPHTARSGLRAFLHLVESFSRYAGRGGIRAVILIGLGAVFESFGILLIVPLLSLVIGAGSTGGRLGSAAAGLFNTFGIATSFGRLALLLSGFAAIMVFRAVVVTLRDSTVMSLQWSYVDHLRMQVASALAGAGWPHVLRLRHARVMNVMGGDIQRVTSAIHFLLQSGIAATILVAQCALSFWLSPALAVFSLALLSVGAALMFPILRQARAVGRHLGMANQQLLDNTGQFLGGLKLAMSQGLQESFLAEMHATLVELRVRQFDFIRRQTGSRSALTTISALVGVAVVLIGYGTLGLSAPVLIAFLIVVGRMSGPATQIQQGFQQMALGLPAYETVCELLAELPPVQEVASGAHPPLSGTVVLHDVVFRHPGAGEDARGVDGVDLVIEPGEIVGLAGSSGAGKTTLADLLVGLIAPQSGRITIGGQPLDAQALAGWREQLSYVSQDSFLFHDTIRRNLQWANPQASEGEMWDALALVGADTIVRRMGAQLDTVVGERGTLVSGGERQRIALARALLRRPKVLLLDEATNAIDIESEAALLRRIFAIRPRPTIILIAHRSETLALCDRVVRLENGRVSAK